MRPVALVGATASGKSALAIALVRAEPQLEIVSADSMQVYRGMDIGTAKPTAAEQAAVRHHVIDVADPWDDYTVARYQRDARAAIVDIEARGKRPLVVGGTGLYVRAVLDDLDIPGQFASVRADLEAIDDTRELHARLTTLDPVTASRMEPTNRRRVVRALEVTVGSGRPFSSYGPGLEAYGDTPFTIVGVALAPSVLADRIAARYESQLASGFMAEVEQLRADPRGMSRTARQALGYKEVLAHLDGELTLDAAVELACARTRRFARRQRAWFARDPRITWLEPGADPMSALGALVAAVT